MKFEDFKSGQIVEMMDEGALETGTVDRISATTVWIRWDGFGVTQIDWKDDLIKEITLKTDNNG